MNVAIVQSDVVTAYGWGLDALWDGLLSNETAIRATDRFVERGFLSNQAAIIPELEIHAGESRAMAMLRRLLRPLIAKIDPLTPLILATTVGEIEYVEAAILSHRPELAADARPQVLLRRIKQLLGLRGAAMVVSCACASSAVAISRAASMIRHGDAKRVLLVACDSVSEFVYSGFSTLLSLCEGPARPFDAQRGGLTLGEGAAWALLASDESPRGGATSILGWGNTTDAVHMTAPDRDARGLSRAIAKACAMAGKTADEISFIAAHGTATLYSDAMELVALRGATRRPRPIFSVKGGVGHTLASAGLVQILVAARAMSLGIVPPTVGLQVLDPSAVDWAHKTSVQIGRAPLALSISSGFGGVNTAVVLGGGDQS
ncbi:MAG: beta-ketoacyl synthase N-terminal-like domain-containing protein [Tepidisphaeraceae bacterium]